MLPADILGQVYEQFLGKVIRLIATAGQRAKVEEKPEVRKAGGVYYTPTYIVDTIVEQTVGKLLEGTTLRQVAGRPRWPQGPAAHRWTRPAAPAPSCWARTSFCWTGIWPQYVAEGPEQWATGRSPRLYRTAAASGG